MKRRLSGPICGSLRNFNCESDKKMGSSSGFLQPLPWSPTQHQNQLQSCSHGNIVPIAWHTEPYLDSYKEWRTSTIAQQKTPRERKTQKDSLKKSSCGLVRILQWCVTEWRREGGRERCKCREQQSLGKPFFSNCCISILSAQQRRRIHTVQYVRQ